MFVNGEWVTVSYINITVFLNSLLNLKAILINLQVVQNAMILFYLTFFEKFTSAMHNKNICNVCT